ncbi:MAG: ATP-binding protein [Rhizobiales bacterium]|nr:ATP-binding protein [Hyphomicrobiales bacterium]MBO6699337.1 ATP-binding protein [Hyphomicrobiales bacterium]MBO6736875.1 ATP-binding protein [Hyphomicrobiales bacterium]MBO6912051.1 ATP-binding protein [Hyphomicrobiales bacterium]MBO6954581.1 ATP-binding protein [Hyphomicrobiales bacterium]
MYDRFVKDRIQEALTDTRVVLISGPRQSGKTTLATDIAAEDIPFFTLDDATVMTAATEDPVGFLRGLERAVIDEIQRAPELLLSIKTEVDKDKSPGRFLLTGSANLMTVPKVADSLAGRMEVVKLLPLSRSEIQGAKSTFLDNAFNGAAPTVETTIIGDDLIEMVLAGGYPEALDRQKWARRQDWYHGYVDAIVQRDVRDIAQIEQLAIMPKLLGILAEHSGQLVNYSGIGSAINLNHVTTQKYVRVFESLFIIQTLQPWFTNKLKRLTKSPKLHFLDAGLLAALRDISPDVVHKDKTSFGAILETFVFSELQKIATWSEQRCSFSHFRDKDKNEVDVVIENRRGEVVGVEVKSSATVSAGDFSGIRRLAEACGDRFVQGIVLYDHDQVVPFAENMRAVPLSCLWSSK